MGVYVTKKVYICYKKVMRFIVIVDGIENPVKFYANNINDLIDFLIDYDIDFDTVKVDTNISDPNNFSLN
jgi:hypothetical protein